MYLGAYMPYMAIRLVGYLHECGDGSNHDTFSSSRLRPQKKTHKIILNWVIIRTFIPILLYTLGFWRELTYVEKIPRDRQSGHKSQRCLHFRGKYQCEALNGSRSCTLPLQFYWSVYDMWIIICNKDEDETNIEIFVSLQFPTNFFIENFRFLSLHVRSISLSTINAFIHIPKHWYYSHFLFDTEYQSLTAPKMARVRVWAHKILKQIAVFTHLLAHITSIC